MAPNSRIEPDPPTAFLESRKRSDKSHAILKTDPSAPISPTQSPHPALGLDYGKARIGIAATDDFGIMAHPVETVEFPGDAERITRIGEIITKRKIRTLVIGLPLRLDGSEGDSAKKVREFSNKLTKAFPGQPMEFIDETYTTMDAGAKLREAGRNARKQKAVIDQAAAVEILNRWMEEIS